GVFLAILGMVPSRFFGVESHTWAMTTLVVLGLWLAPALWLFYRWLRPAHGLILVRRAERSPFMAQHGADILKATIAAVIGGLLTALIIKAIEGPKVFPP